MSRPVGVTISAVVCALGSVFALLGAVGMVAALSMPEQPVPGIKGVVIVSAVVFAALAVLGLWTAVDLFRMRRWARTSILVFSGIIAAVCIPAAAVVPFFMKLPPTAAPGAEGVTKVIVLATYLVPALIGVWWLVYFNLAGTKAAFAEAAGGVLEVSPRPLSISIIGWWGVVAGAMCLFPVLLRLPAFFLGMTFTGAGATIVYVLLGGINASIGWELLRLNERARQLAIGWYVFTIGHIGFITLVPGQYQKMLQAQNAALPSPPVDTVVDAERITLYMTGVTVPLILVLIWFLVRNKAAFRRDDATSG